jgi:predicted ABC-type ATPase
MKNFFKVYKDSVDRWMVYDNSNAQPIPIATGNSTLAHSIINDELWQKITTPK